MLYFILAVVAAGWISLRGDSLVAVLTPESLTTAGWLRDLGAGVAAGAVALLVWEGLRRLASARVLESNLQQLLTGVSRSEAGALAALSGFAEELFFRGAVQPSAGLWATAAIFGLVHFAPGRGGLLWMLWAFVMGLALGMLTIWTSALVAPIVAHMTVNGVGLLRLVDSNAKKSREDDTPPG